MKPLFIPLRGVYFDAFDAGIKKHELRKYGPRWNEKTCPPSRPVILSRGYGKQHRLVGVIEKFRRARGADLVDVGPFTQATILQLYGTLEIEIAVIKIKDIKRK
jgi:hypothetical protein